MIINIVPLPKGSLYNNNAVIKPTQLPTVIPHGKNPRRGNIGLTLPYVVILFKDDIGMVSPLNKVIVESNIDVTMGYSMVDTVVSI